MAPRISTNADDDASLVVNKEQKSRKTVLDIGNIKKALPSKVFVKSLFTSVSYMARDYAIWFGLVALMKVARSTDTWSVLPYWQQTLASCVFWLVTGFFMWTVFMIGHDCGHGSFSEYEWVNDLVGHVAHGSLLVPYHPWQLSHRRHHLYHNHIEKDYSHPWNTPEGLERPENANAKMVEGMPLLKAIFPIIGWHLYLLGYPDGNHYIPSRGPHNRLFTEHDTPTSEYAKAYLSTGVVLLYVVTFFYTMGEGNWADFAYYYLAPYCVFAWWIVTVTYLQHHSPGTLVYDDSNWNFVTAAFETVDRRFGFGIDELHHHITDGHVVHHLFFKHIPHYHLKTATDALRKYLNDNGVGELYRFEDTLDFPYRVHKYYMDHGLMGSLLTEDGVKAGSAASTASKASTIAKIAEEVTGKKSKSSSSSSASISARKGNNTKLSKKSE